MGECVKRFLKTEQHFSAITARHNCEYKQSHRVARCVSTSRSRSQEFWFVMELSDHRRLWRQRETVGSPFCEIELAVRPSWSRTPGTPQRERGWIRRRASRCNSDHFCVRMYVRHAHIYMRAGCDAISEPKGRFVPVYVRVVQSNSRHERESCTREIAKRNYCLRSHL